MAEYQKHFLGDECFDGVATFLTLIKLRNYLQDLLELKISSFNYGHTLVFCSQMSKQGVYYCIIKVSANMGIKDFLRNLFLRFDLLSVEPTLRLKGETSYSTLCGGTVSLIMLLTFSAIFFNNFFSVLNRTDITYSTTEEDDPTSTKQINFLKLAVGINGVNFSSMPYPFSITLWQNKVYSKTNISKTVIKLSLCNLQDWSYLGKNFEKQFNGFGLGNMFCIDNNESISLYGYSGSSPYFFMSLEISLCQTGIPNCNTRNNSYSQMTSYLNLHNLYQVRLFLADTILTPSNSDPDEFVFEKNLIISFTETTGTVGYAYIGAYSVETDNSVLPYEDYTYITGTKLDTYTTTTIPIKNVNTAKFVQFQFYKSTKTITVTRSYGKILDLFSYVGGLFSIIFVFLSFFFSSYSQYSYEISVGESEFAIDKTGRRFREKDFNFLKYVKYSIYDWMKSIGIQLKWEVDQRIDEVLTESRNSMDISLILKRLRYLQNLNSVLLDEHKRLSLMVATPPTIDQAKKIRQSLDAYDKLISKIEECKQQATLKVHCEENTKEFIEINDASLNCKTLGGRQISNLFDPGCEIDRELMDALRRLKRTNDSQAQKIKEKILLEIMENLPEELFEQIGLMNQHQFSGNSSYFQPNSTDP